MIYFRTTSTSFLQMIPSVVFNVDASAKELNEDLAKVQDWVLQWKMSFNPALANKYKK